MKLRRFAGAALSIALAAVPAAPSAFASEPLRGLLSRLGPAEPYAAAWIGPDLDDAYWRGIAYGLADEARWAGIELIRRPVDPAAGVEGQVAVLEALEDPAPAIVFLSPAADEGFEAPLARLRAAGSTVVAVGAPLRRGPVALAVLPDQAGLGARMARYMCVRAEAARIATMPGPAGQAWSQLRFEGFRDEIAKACPAARLFGNSYRLEAGVAHGQVQAAELAIRYPQADFLYAASGALAFGAARVRQRLRQRAAIVTAGLTREAAAALGTGDIAMAVSVPAVLIGRLAVQYAIRAAEDKGLPGAVPEPYPYPAVFAPMVSITRDLLGDYDIESYDLAPAGWRPDAG